MRLISLLFLANHCDGFYVASNIQQSRSVLSTLIRSVPSDFSGRHSFVEGDRYDGKLEEIEAMGGGTIHCIISYYVFTIAVLIF